MKFNLIKDEARLASFFNSIMRRLNPMRMMCAPKSFHRVKDIAAFQDEKYCDFCRNEMWMHEVIITLRDWEEILDEYFGEFEGAWKYYAASKRLEYLEENEEEETEATRDEDYYPFSVVTDLYDEEFTDIVSETVPDDLNGLCGDLFSNAKMDIVSGLRKKFGAEKVQMFKETEDGEVVPLSQEEYELNNISFQVQADDDIKRIKAISAVICTLYEMIKSCPCNEDNTETLTDVREAAKALLDLDFDTLDTIVKRYAKRKGYENNLHD